MMKAWMRVLGIIVSSTKFKKTVSYGFNEIDNLSINISGTKYLSSLKDNFSIRIDNLPYIEVVKLINNEFDRISIMCGYQYGTSSCIFDGAILNISNEKIDASTNSVIFVCCAKILGLFNRRMNLSLSSGINMYSALSLICRQAGINNPKISTELKGRIIQNTLNISGSAASIIDTICKSNKNVLSQSDSSNTATISIWDSTRTSQRVIELNPRTIIVANGYPTLSSDGLTIYVMPTFNFMPGDVIKLDNAYINVSQSSKQEVLSDPNIGMWFDEKGEYMIYQISYNLSNRGNSFSLQMLCKKRSLSTMLTGGTK